MLKNSKLFKIKKKAFGVSLKWSSTWIVNRSIPTKLGANHILMREADFTCLEPSILKKMIYFLWLTYCINKALGKCVFIDFNCLLYYRYLSNTFCLQMDILLYPCIPYDSAHNELNLTFRTFVNQSLHLVDLH